MMDPLHQKMSKIKEILKERFINCLRILGFYEIQKVIFIKVTQLDFDFDTPP
jgi:hypothetical protein